MNRNSHENQVSRGGTFESFPQPLLWTVFAGLTVQVAIAVLGVLFVSFLAASGTTISVIAASLISIVSMFFCVLVVRLVPPTHRSQFAVTSGSLTLLNLILWSLCVGSAWMLIPLVVSILMGISIGSLFFPVFGSILDSKRMPDAPADNSFEPASMTIPLDFFEADESDEEDQNVIQSFYRTIDDSGHQTIGGTWKVGFESRQKTVVLHVPLWPHVDKDFNVSGSAVDSESYSVKATVVAPSGFRFEVKRLGNCSNAAEVVIEWYAQPKSSAATTGDIPRTHLTRNKEAL
jgi:hypothetical protein